MKRCTVCGIEQALTGFYGNPRSPDGHRSDCKSCVLAKRKTSYQPRPRAALVDLPKRSKFIPCEECGEDTWVKVSTGRTSAKHKRCGRAHGTAAMYRGGCKCEECRRWNAQSASEYRSSRKAAGKPIRKTYFWVTATTRVSIYERDGWVCQICFEPVDRDAHYNDDMAPSLDHIVAKSLGGSHDAENLRTTHRRCNCLRGDGTREMVSEVRG